jgi:hypothetical protein
MRTVSIGLLAAAVLGGCAGHVSFNPMSNPYNHAIAWARANSACDAGGRASAEPASGCMIPRPGMEK